MRDEYENEVRLYREAGSMITRLFYVSVRLSEKERRKIKEQAEASHLMMSEYIRRRVQRKRVVSQADLAILAELRSS
jgi:hypothetical protein